MKSCRLCDSSFMKNWASRDAKTGETLNLGLCGGTNNRFMAFRKRASLLVTISTLRLCT